MRKIPSIRQIFDTLGLSSFRAEFFAIFLGASSLACAYNNSNDPLRESGPPAVMPVEVVGVAPSPLPKEAKVTETEKEYKFVNDLAGKALRVGKGVVNGGGVVVDVVSGGWRATCDMVNLEEQKGSN